MLLAIFVEAATPYAVFVVQCAGMRQNITTASRRYYISSLSVAEPDVDLLNRVARSIVHRIKRSRRIEVQKSNIID